jgi:LacI family transcriptional regulator
VDNRQAAEQAVRLLVENGHKNIGIIGGPEDIFTARERLEGYCSVLEQEGIPVRESLIYHGDYTIQGGVRGMEELLDRNPDMTAVFVTNYEMTMGTVIGLNERDIRIPDQLSLIGFDNLEFARACSPRLTIISQPTEQIAREAARRILERLEGGEPSCKTEKLQTKILMGKSVGRPPVTG